VRIAQRSPQLPQLFAQIDDSSVIAPGAFLRATCIYNSSERDTVTYAGNDHTDEMCNLCCPLPASSRFLTNRISPGTVYVLSRGDCAVSFVCTYEMHVCLLTCAV
jgi:hypothetical protein